MIIYSKNSVLEALKSGQTFNKLLLENGVKDSVIEQIFDFAKKNKIKVLFENKEGLTKLAGTPKHQGVVGEVVDFVYTELSDVINKIKNSDKKAFLLILDGIEDPHNFGAIIRSAECAGVDAVIIPKNRAVQVNETVIRTSVGAVNYIPICVVTNINQTIETLKENNVWIYGVELGGKSIYDEKFDGGVALIIGSEGKGVSRLTKEKCDEIVTIPMFGKINSLNASVSTGIALFEVVRNRLKK